MRPLRPIPSAALAVSLLACDGGPAGPAESGTGTLIGWIQDQHGQGADASRVLLERNGYDSILSRYAGVDGRVTINNVAAGDWSLLVVHAPGYGYTDVAPRTVRIHADDTTTATLLTTATIGFIHGFVTSGGVPVEAAVRATATIQAVTTSASGFYQLRLPEGTYEFEVIPPDGFATPPIVEVTVVGGLTDTLDVDLLATDAMEVDVAVGDGAFTPDSLQIRPGSTVHWRRDTSGTLTITPDGHNAWNRTIFFTPADTVFSARINAEGVYRYYCEEHDGMSGVIVVD